MRSKRSCGPTATAITDPHRRRPSCSAAALRRNKVRRTRGASAVIGGRRYRSMSVVQRRRYPSAAVAVCVCVYTVYVGFRVRGLCDRRKVRPLRRFCHLRGGGPMWHFEFFRFYFSSARRAYLRKSAHYRPRPRSIFNHIPAGHAGRVFSLDRLA